MRTAAILYPMSIAHGSAGAARRRSRFGETGMTAAATADAVLAFWRQAGKAKWFAKDDAFDRQCRGFAQAWRDAAAGRLAAWEGAPDSALALVLLLDQFPRNMFRGTPQVYASDPQARAAAGRALDRGFDARVAPELRQFFYLPFAHAEAIADQDRSVALARATGDPQSLKWAEHHRGIVQRFGRFPHRNAILGRRSTKEEMEWLAGEGAFKG